MSISRRCFLSSRSEASRNIPRTTMVAPAKINSQTYRVSIITASYTNFVVAHYVFVDYPPHGLRMQVKGKTLKLAIRLGQAIKYPPACRVFGLMGVDFTSSAPLMLTSGGPPRRGVLELWASNQTDLKLPCRQHLSPTVLLQYLQ